MHCCRSAAHSQVLNRTDHWLKRQPRKRLPLLEVSINLGQAAGHDNSLAVLEAFERLADRWMYDYYKSLLAERLSALSPDIRKIWVETHPEFRVFDDPPGQFRSLADTISSEDRLMLIGSLRVTEGGLQARMSMDRKLHRLFEARRFVTASRMKPQK